MKCQSEESLRDALDRALDIGKVDYMTDGVSLRLTLVGQEDLGILKSEGLSGLRRKRLMRLANEAVAQGALLCYDDMCCLLISSVSTLKRDVSIIEEAGISVPLKGRRMRPPCQSDGMAADA